MSTKNGLYISSIIVFQNYRRNVSVGFYNLYRFSNSKRETTRTEENSKENAPIRRSKARHFILWFFPSVYVNLFEKKGNDFFFLFRFYLPTRENFISQNFFLFRLFPFLVLPGGWFCFFSRAIFLRALSIDELLFGGLIYRGSKRKS